MCIRWVCVPDACRSHSSELGKPCSFLVSDGTDSPTQILTRRACVVIKGMEFLCDETCRHIPSHIMGLLSPPLPDLDRDLTSEGTDRL